MMRFNLPWYWRVFIRLRLAVIWFKNLLKTKKERDDGDQKDPP